MTSRPMEAKRARLSGPQALRKARANAATWRVMVVRMAVRTTLKREGVRILKSKGTWTRCLHNASDGGDNSANVDVDAQAELEGSSNGLRDKTSVVDK